MLQGSGLNLGNGGTVCMFTRKTLLIERVTVIDAIVQAGADM
jgi:hypothetical protein